MSRDRYCFHIEGGARLGGSTLTAKAASESEAKVEAKAFWHLGRGDWRFTGTIGPDIEGNFYRHYHWRPLGDIRA